LFYGFILHKLPLLFSNSHFLARLTEPDAYIDSKGFFNELSLSIRYLYESEFLSVDKLSMLLLVLFDDLIRAPEQFFRSFLNSKLGESDIFFLLELRLFRASLLSSFSVVNENYSSLRYWTLESCSSFTLAFSYLFLVSTLFSLVSTIFAFF